MIRRRIGAALAAVLAVGSLTLLPGTANASTTSEFPPIHVKCMKFLDSALTAVHQMNMANSAMAHAAGNGDVDAFKEASNDYDSAARDYNRAANRYSNNGCPDVTGLPLPTPPAKFPG